MKGSEAEMCAKRRKEAGPPQGVFGLRGREPTKQKKTSSNNKQKALQRTRTDTCKYAYLHRDIIGNAEVHRRNRGKKKRISTTKEIEQEPLRDHRVNKNKKRNQTSKQKKR